MLRDQLQVHLLSRLPAALDFLRRMVEINSFTTNAAGVDAVGALPASAFAALGFGAEFVPADNPVSVTDESMLALGSPPLGLLDNAIVTG